MSLTDRVPPTLTRAAVGAYVLWLVAVVLVIAGRYTPFPTLPGVEPGVLVGALCFTAVGAAQLLRRAGRWLSNRLSRS
ncbi:MAG: hypothetical protein U5K28_10075 [Halobacteriales archaeon]|nr:hypothetical protein [Halobacteriales archaeon]